MSLLVLHLLWKYLKETLCCSISAEESCVSHKFIDALDISH